MCFSSDTVSECIGVSLFGSPKMFLSGNRPRFVSKTQDVAITVIVIVMVNPNIDGRRFEIEMREKREERNKKIEERREKREDGRYRMFEDIR